VFAAGVSAATLVVLLVLGAAVPGANADDYAGEYALFAGYRTGCTVVKGGGLYKLNAVDPQLARERERKRERERGRERERDAPGLVSNP
jgi:hypothetical protein